MDAAAQTTSSSVAWAATSLNYCSNNSLIATPSSPAFSAKRCHHAPRARYQHLRVCCSMTAFRRLTWRQPIACRSKLRTGHHFRNNCSGTLRHSAGPWGTQFPHAVRPQLPMRPPPRSLQTVSRKQWSTLSGAHRQPTQPCVPLKEPRPRLNPTPQQPGPKNSASERRQIARRLKWPHPPLHAPAGRVGAGVAAHRAGLVVRTRTGLGRAACRDRAYRSSIKAHRMSASLLASVAAQEGARLATWAAARLPAHRASLAAHHASLAAQVGTSPAAAAQASASPAAARSPASPHQILERRQVIPTCLYLIGPAPNTKKTCRSCRPRNAARRGGWQSQTGGLI